MDLGGVNAVIFTGCCLFVVHIVKYASDLLSPDWRSGAFETCGKFARLLRSRLRKRDTDELEEEVAGRLLDWQLSQFQVSLKMFLNVSVMPFVVIAFCKGALGIHRYHTLAQDTLLVLGYAGLILADCCPWLVTKRNLDLWYSAFMTLLCLFILPPFCTENRLLEAALAAKMVGALLSLARMNLSVVVVWSGVHTACEYWTHSIKGQSMAMNLWLVWPFMLSMLIGKFEAHLEAELRKDIAAKVMQNRQSAGDALSAMFYDVVVELDHNRCITAPTRNLAAFLLRTTPVQLDGTPLEDLLLDEEDRARFRNLLCPANGPAASSFVELAHARMRGSMGTVIEVELFGYRFFGHSGRQRYLVGIREAGDFEKGGVPMAHAGLPPESMAPADEEVVVIDPAREQFPILSHTPGFSSSIVPVAEGTCLLPMVVRGAMFKAWVEAIVNWHIAAFSEDEEMPGEPPAESYMITFRPRDRNRPMRVEAVCKFRIEERDPSDGRSWDGEVAVELKLSSIVHVPRGLGSADSGSSTSSSSISSRSGTPGFGLRASLQTPRPATFGARMTL